MRLTRPRAGFDPAEAIEQFHAALAARDIVPPARIISDGDIHRCDAAGKNSKGDAAYVLHLDGIAAGRLENWRDGKGWVRCGCDSGRALASEEFDGLHRRAEAARARRDDETAKRPTASGRVISFCRNLFRTTPPPTHEIG